MTDITIQTPNSGNDVTIDVAKGTDLTLDVSIGNAITLAIDKGMIGPQGEAATVAVGSTTTLSAGTNATVNNSGTSTDAVLNFGIPQGIQGVQGIQGIQGIQGATGAIGATGATGATGAGVAVGGTTGQVLAKTSNADYATGWTTPTSGTVTSVSATAGTGISVTGSPITSSGTLNITNTAPDQTVVLTAGTGISTSGTYPNFTVTNSAPDQTVAITSGTGISVTGTYPNFTVANTSPSSGGTVTAVTGTSPVVSSGGNTPAISMAQATNSVNGYLSATDWTTFNSKGSGTVTSVTATSPVTSTGGTTPVIAMPAATTSVNGYLTSTDWTTFNNKSNTSGTVTSVTAGTGLSGGTITGTGTIAIDSTVVTLTDTQTLTNKRINPRVTNITSSSTITPPSDTADQYSVTALAVPATIAIPSGTPVAGQKLTIRIKDDGTARALTWTTSAGGYRVIGSTLPTTTVISKTVYVGCIYNSAESFWDVVAVAQQV